MGFHLLSLSASFETGCGIRRRVSGKQHWALAKDRRDYEEFRGVQTRDTRPRL